MSVPKKQKTSSKTKKGRSHQALKKVILSICSKCKKAVKKHLACSFCGAYKSRNTKEPEVKQVAESTSV